MTTILWLRVGFSVIETALLVWMAILLLRMRDGEGRKALVVVFIAFGVREAMAAATWALQISYDPAVVMWYGAWAAIPHAAVLLALIGLMRAVIRRGV
jgi:hypothetical protein